MVSKVGASSVQRRYLVYVPTELPQRPLPIVFVLPGASTNAEGAAQYYTHGRFETLADRDGFVVVYANGLPFGPRLGQFPTPPQAGSFDACFARHADEGIDVKYVRLIVEQLASQLNIDRDRIYATGLSAGGGLSFELALEAPDLIAAIAPVVPVPFEPSGRWLHHCHAKPGFAQVSIAMLAATADRFVAFAPGSSPMYPSARFPGMQQVRDTWRAALGIQGEPTVDEYPDLVKDDSYQPHSGATTSTILRLRYPAGPQGQELWYYEARGAGHWWPSPTQIWTGLWNLFGKTNQDIDFADEAWAFFQRHKRHA